MITLEVGSTSHADAVLCIKRALSHVESLLGCHNGYVMGAPSSRAGWTFFKLSFKSEMEDAMRAKFADMMERYRRANGDEKFARFVSDYLESRGCAVRVSV